MIFLVKTIPSGEEWHDCYSKNNSQKSFLWLSPNVLWGYIFRIVLSYSSKCFEVFYGTLKPKQTFRRRMIQYCKEIFLFLRKKFPENCNKMWRKIETRGPFINDVMQIWTFSDPPPPSVTFHHKNVDPHKKDVTNQCPPPRHPPPPSRKLFLRV